jgi:hypothetical protein
LNHSSKIVKVVFPSGGYAPEALQPSEETLHLPSPTVSSQGPPILSRGPFPSGSMRCDHLDAKGGQLCIKRIAVIGLVSDDPLRELNQETAFEGFSNQFHFMRRSAVHVEGDRKTMAVRNCHDFRSFPPFRFPHARPPFFAGEKVPSMKASLRSRSPRSRRSSAKAKRMSSKTPSLDHFWCHRWQVDLGGYRRGRSSHCAPVRSIQRMPLSTERGLVRVRPRGSERSEGIRGSTTAHCSLVKSIHHILNIFHQSTRTKPETFNLFWDEL